jgi:N-hydroxyarylamine O-acetyltransferase
MRVDDVAAKLLGGPGARRGGYCFEQNALLGAALGALGFRVEPLLCRVRWNKAPSEVTAFTHMALRVVIPSDQMAFLADVGFAGTNSVAPVELNGEAHVLPEGRFRAVEDATVHGYVTLQWELRGVWRDLYVFRADEAAVSADLEMSNFYSHAHPTSRFMNQFFVARVVGDARHHILNDVHSVRSAHDGASASEETRIVDSAQLLRLLDGVFGIDAPEGAVEAWEARYKRAA